MSNAEVWLVIALMTIANLATRTSFFLLGNSVKLPAKLQHALRYAPAAALAAIVAPDLVVPGAPLATSLMHPKLLAAIGATVFFITTRHMLWTILVGMGMYTGLRLLM